MDYILSLQVKQASEEPSNMRSEKISWKYAADIAIETRKDVISYKWPITANAASVTCARMYQEMRLHWLPFAA